MIEENNKNQFWLKEVKGDCEVKLRSYFVLKIDFYNVYI